MTDHQFHRDNHYVPRFCLKNWASSSNYLWVYRTLVQDQSVPLWKKNSVKGVAYHSHLYTRIVGGQETDEIEQWLDKKFEGPAVEPIRKATSGCKLKPADWKCLSRFVVAQYIRTPAWYLRWSKRMEQNGAEILKSTLKETKNKFEEAQATGKAVTKLQPLEGTQDLPIKVTAEIREGHEDVLLKVETVLGRDVWQFLIRQLDRYVLFLENIRWAICTPPAGMFWITSDDPVIRLNYYSSGKYDFNGGFGNNGTEILFPLGPRHLLYAKVGHRPKLRAVIQKDQAELIQKFIAEHAHRFIYANEPNNLVPLFRPRVVNPEQVESEKDQWLSWHEKHTAAARELLET